MYNGFEQLISRVITNSGTANGTFWLRFGCPPATARYFVHDQWGNVIAELTTAGATVREYIWLPETEIGPARQSRAQVDRPIAVIDGVNTATPATLMVHVDHLNRPVRMTDSTKASVWDAVYTPWGAPQAITGAQTLNARFPGQWFQLESGLHYNWHRHYDPSLGRFTQPDPLGFVDGPSVYAYAANNLIAYVDKDGRLIFFVQGGGSVISGAGGTASAGSGHDFTSGKDNAFISKGAGVGLDIGYGGGVGIFFGDWCQFSGTSYNLSISLFDVELSAFISGGRLGGSISYTPGPSPVGTSFTINDTKLHQDSCGCGK